MTCSWGSMGRLSGFELDNPVAQTFKDYIVDCFSVDLSPYDIVRGYRADDSYYSYAKDFLQNSISLEQLARGMMKRKK